MFVNALRSFSEIAYVNPTSYFYLFCVTCQFCGLQGMSSCYDIFNMHIYHKILSSCMESQMSVISVKVILSLSGAREGSQDKWLVFGILPLW